MKTSSSPSITTSPQLQEPLPLLSKLIQTTDHHHPSSNLDIQHKNITSTFSTTNAEVNVTLNIGPPTTTSSSDHYPKHDKGINGDEQLLLGFPCCPKKKGINGEDELLVGFHWCPSGSSLKGFNRDDDQMVLGLNQYWVPNPSQILTGPNKFSCPVCSKIFTRYNNLQVCKILVILNYAIFSKTNLIYLTKI